jgi:hypothetical protein
VRKVKYMYTYINTIIILIIERKVNRMKYDGKKKLVLNILIYKNIILIQLFIYVLTQQPKGQL